MKYYTEEYLHNKYNKLTKTEKINTLIEALDYMQQYNGRSKFQCIIMAMGFDNNEGTKDSYFKMS